AGTGVRRRTRSSPRPAATPRATAVGGAGRPRPRRPSTLRPCHPSRALGPSDPSRVPLAPGFRGDEPLSPEDGQRAAEPIQELDACTQPDQVGEDGNGTDPSGAEAHEVDEPCRMHSDDLDALEIATHQRPQLLGPELVPMMDVQRALEQPDR